MNSKLDFCDEYGYPVIVREVLEQIVKLINPEKVISVFLHGSTTRGEFSVRIDSGKYILMSDMEFQIIARSHVEHKDAMRISRELAVIEKKLQKDSPYFHFDYSYVTHRKFRKLPKHFITFEKKAAGKTIFGEDIICDLPEVTLENIKFSELNEIFIWRLWALLVYLPTEWIKYKKLSYEREQYYVYFLFRNVLDLTTWALQHEGHLIAGFNKRVNRFKKINKIISCKNLINDNFVAFLDRALKAKLTARSSMSINDLYKLVINYFELAICDLVNLYSNRKQNPMAESIIDSNSILMMDGTTFTDITLRRKLLEIIQWSRSFGKGHKNMVPFSWLIRHKMLHVLAFLLEMHKAAKLIIFNQKDNYILEVTLNRAEMLMRSLKLVDECNRSEACFEDRWLFLRMSFVDTFSEMISGINSKLKYFYRCLEEEPAEKD